MKTLAAVRAQSQLFVEPLPAHSNFWHGHVGIIITELIISPGCRNFERMKTRNCILGAEDRNISLDIKGEGLSAAAGGGDGRVARDIAGNIQRIGILL